ncbi:hypothetical protein [Rurimicrobium arvi]|uniref:hypothetical protein n=1 Tax=Rurimicrobium arvi TaxID=2049916 RepID=UPI0031DBB336
MDEAQVDQYEALIRQHRSAVIAIDKETAGLKRTLYQSLLVPANRDSLINLIGEQQKNIERVNLAHFEDIKALCRPEQQERFTQLVQELDQLFNHPHHPPARPGPR